MNKKHNIIITSIISVMALSACSIFDVDGDDDDIIHVESVSLIVEETELIVGQKIPYRVEILPDDATDKDYELSSSDESIVRFTQTNIVANGKGEASITVTTFDGDFSDTVNFNVINEDDIDHTIHVESINLSVPRTNLTVGESIGFDVEVLPEEATDKTYTLSSSNPSILEVDTKIHALSTGEASVVVTSNDGEKIDSIDFVIDSLVDGFTGYAPSNYSLAWSDEFNDISLNKNYWEPMIGNGANYNVWGWGNNEEEYYKEENATVGNGALQITAKREQTTFEHNDHQYTYNFTSARLRSKGKVTTTYGYIEARIKLPAGTGLWPAFWMLPETSFHNKGWPTSGEIDIMEARGRIPTTIGSTLHTANSNGQDAYHGRDAYLDNRDDITNYHCYGTLWEEDRFTFYLDGEAFYVCTYNTYQNGYSLYINDGPSAPFNKPFHLLLNLAIGGNYDGGRSVSEDFVSAQMLVDYVRIFQKNG